MNLTEMVTAACRTNGVDPENVSVTVVENDVYDTFNPNMPFYPASVVKLFHLRAMYAAIAVRDVKNTPELRRAAAAMIGWSSNDADAYVVDRITKTANHDETYAAWKVWLDKRTWVNRYFGETLGYGPINVAAKTYDDSAYGLETRILKNFVTSEQAARCMWEIARGTAISALSALSLLRRDLGSKPEENDQATDFLAHRLTQEPGLRVYSKAGWGPISRHDVALFVQGDKKLVISAFTKAFNRRPLLWDLGELIWRGQQ